VATVTLVTSITVEVNSPAICPGNETVLTATGAGTYLWSDGSSGNSITVAPTSETTYTVTGTSGSCTGTAVATVTMQSALEIEVNSLTMCAGNNATLVAEGADSYAWSNGSTSDSINVSPETTTSYTVTGIKNSCSGTAVATVTIDTSFTISVNSQIISAGSEATLTANGASSYHWSTGDSTNQVVVKPNVTTSYMVAGTANGCRDTAIATVVVVNDTAQNIKCVDLFVPNAFSPNNDGLNDIEFVLGNCIAKMQFIIFNRWGEKVFESTNPKEAWDGTFNGEKMNTAVFVYYLKATLITGEEIVQKGNISLLR
jgi:gliding motility-associated-like protein